MNIFKNKFTILFATLIFVCSYSSIAQAKTVELNGVRHFSSDNYTRIVIDLASSSEYKYHLLKKDPSINKPRRLFVDIDSTKIKPGISKVINVNNSMLKQIRVGQNKSDVVRVVLDLSTVGDIKVFHLKSPFRIVIDVYSDGNGIDTVKGSSKEIAVKTKVKDTKKDDKSKPVKLKTQSKGVSVVVIDAGHGGKDPGALSKKKTLEKDITLKLVKLLRDRLKKSLPKTKVILTRDTDVFIPLEKRTAIANSKNADIFVSIHVNASPRRQARGLETYYLDYTHDKEAMRVAARENAVSQEEMSEVDFIIRDMIKTGNREESARLAELVQKKMVANLSKNYSGINSHGVKGAPFYVLVSSNMPSILVEVGFISNPEEEKRLKNNKYLNEIIKGIENGIIEYINGIK